LAAEIQSLVALIRAPMSTPLHAGREATVSGVSGGEPSAGRDALWAADATTGHAGQRFCVAERADEVVAR
jgi:hypothetical protein